ncbi:MAG: monovalent cation:proton antiporter-2 (CPA2) family protein, partial [Pseudoalteromonas rhizosphaerae]
MQSVLAQIFGLLLAAVVLVWLFKRIGLPPILAYLATGLLAGSHGIGWMAQSHEIHFVAELGIVFLLFSLGLEFSVGRLMAMRNIVFGLGTLQVIVTSIVFMLILLLMDLSLLSSFTIATLMALSSTAVVVKLLKETGELKQRRGQLAIGMLLFQDIAVVPLLITLPLLAQSSDTEGIAWALTFALTKGAFVCLLLWMIGKWVLPKVFSEVALMRTDELFVLTTLVVALFAAGLTYLFGLSMALGAFLAGMMLGESQYRHQLEADIRPFRDILMGLFFVTVGMQLDILYVFGVWYW